MTRWHSWVPAALLLTAIASGCGRTGDRQEASPRPEVPVRVERLVERMAHSIVKAQGQWRAADSLTITAPFKAYVDSIAPRAGDAVRRGEVIGALVTYESRAAVHGAEILLGQARSAAEREEAKRALDLAKRDLVRVPLVSGASGVVLRRSAEPGSVVAEAGELLTLVPEGAIVFEAHVPRSDAARISPGVRATIAMEGGGLVDARVERRLPRTDEADQSALCWLAPASKEPFGVLGRFGTATIETGAEHRAVLVPDSALVEDDLTGELRLARVLPGDIAVWVTVHVAPGDSGRHELLAPALAPGTPVVVRGQRGLPDSTRVVAGP